METFIFTWDGTDPGYPAAVYAEHVTETGAGGSVVMEWSTGTRKRGFARNDRVYLLRQHNYHGIIASGTVVTGTLLKEAHWEDQAKDAYYLEVSWNRVLDTVDRLPISALRAAVPIRNNWSPQGGGQRLDPADAERLAMLWTRHIEGLAGDPTGETAEVAAAGPGSDGNGANGQGFGLSATERAIIERHAVDIATRHLIAAGYVVTDVGTTRPYDLDALRADKHLFVEVKGTMSSGREVILTHGEVELNARGHPDTMLMIVHNIELTRKPSSAIASGGVLKIVHPWQVADEDLTPIAYRYVVPQHDQHL